MNRGDREHEWVLALALMALALRIHVAAHTVIPAEDGVNYLWMAERLAGLDPVAALSEVFPPLLPLLVAPFVGLGADPFVAAQMVLAVAGALSVVVGASLATRIVDGGRVPAAVLLTTAALPVRFCGEVYTEPLFLLVASAATLCGVRGRPVQMGVLCGLAAWARPEGLLIGLVFALLQPRRMVIGLAIAGGFLLALAVCRAALGLGFDLLPKLGFNLPKSTFGADVPLLPAAWLEAFGLTGLLALGGGILTLRKDPPSDRMDQAVGPWPPAKSRSLLLLLLSFAVLVIVAFAPRRRFLVSWLFVVVPFAVLFLLRVPRPMRLLLILLAAVSGILGSIRVTDRDRLGEVVVGKWLGQVLAAEDAVVTDMTRVLWYAGRRPLSPRHFEPEELIAAAANPAARFVVLGARRRSYDLVVSGLGDRFEKVELPFAPEAAALIESRGIVVFLRR